MPKLWAYTEKLPRECIPLCANSEKDNFKLTRTGTDGHGTVHSQTGQHVTPKENKTIALIQAVSELASLKNREHAMHTLPVSTRPKITSLHHNTSEVIKISPPLLHSQRNSDTGDRNGLPSVRDVSNNQITKSINCVVAATKDYITGTQLLRGTPSNQSTNSTNMGVSVSVHESKC